MYTTSFKLLLLAGLASIGLTSGATAAPPEDAALYTNSDGIELLPSSPRTGYQLRIMTPDGTVSTHEFGPGELPVWPVDNGVTRMSDGMYKYELRRVLPTSHRPAHAGSNAAATQARPDAVVASGAFTISNGAVVSQDVEEPVGAKNFVTTKDQVINDDLIVTSSLCVGFDCVNGENFGFDTIRMKENNTRLDFTDTSVGSFPTEDWQLVANDSANGGLNAFWIQSDGPSGTGRRVFLVEAGAPSNALYVDDRGRVGFGTSTPVVELHSADGDTPTLRLEQDGSSGFQPQTWDVAGNEANFFVRDVTSGSRLPFRIRPGAPTSSIDIASTGNVGIGTASPQKLLHLLAASADQLGQNNTMARIENNSGTEAPRRMLELINNGSPLLVYKDSSTGDIWNLSPVGGRFVISLSGSGGQEFEMDGNGNVTIRGSLTENSSRNSKEGFAAVDTDTLLAKLEQLRIEEWHYSHTPNSRHVGPMAEDFHAIFGLGPNDGIAPRDMAGVALAAAKALRAENQSLKVESAAKEERIESLEARIARLESLVLDSR